MHMFLGFLLRKALGEELQTTVIRWKNPPPGKRHEAEVSMPDPPKWTKKIPMHFCPVRQAYVCPVPVVKGRLLVRFLVDDKVFPFQPMRTKDGDRGDSPGLLLLPGRSLGERIAPQYPWKAARRWLQQQQQQHEQKLQQQDLPEQEEKQHGDVAAQQQVQPQERRQQQQRLTLAAGLGAQHCLEKGALEAPLRPPRRFGVGLLGSSDSVSSWSGTNRNERNVYSWGAPCRPPWTPVSSSSEERELSPLQRRPSWASGARLNQERQDRVPPRWRQHEMDDPEVEQQKERQGQDRQQQQQQQHRQQPGGSQQQHNEGLWAANNSSESSNCPEARDVGFLSSPTSSSKEAETKEAAETTQEKIAATGSAAVSTSYGEASRGVCTPQLPAASSYWAFCRSSSSSTDSLRGPSPRGDLYLSPLSSPGCLQQRPGPSLHRCSLSPLLSESRASLETPCKQGEWPRLTDEEYSWNSWPWGLSDSRGLPSIRITGPPGSPDHEVKVLPGGCCLQRPADPTASGSCSCNTHDGSHHSAPTSPPSRGGQGPQGPPGPLRKCRESLIDSADLTGGLLWARRRSHSYWDLGRPFSTGHLMLKFTRSLSLQW
ncbi:hypothetical protein, conserved [Eimeria brunetti]|uniref:Uncharacterized protein n=1 Tax=Eimeria brunetti TaxID=51314 RepID=U6LHS5_9EIME|nr:hypothetical protein, conserved [Eimeria brunetti]